MADIKEVMAETKDVTAILKQMGTNSSQLITGLSGSARTIVVATLLEKKQKTII